MGKNETNNGKKGGLLKGKPHYDKNGKPLGGIKAIVTDTNTPVELEGGEVIINKEASKKYWRELSKINQSAGNGVPIKNPNGSFDEDPEEYKDGGNVIQFNPNHTPSKIIINYAKKIKSEYPKVWDKGGNIFGNEAFKNLNRVSERGYWLDSEKWMYIKWRSYVARHKQDFRINGVVAMLKWADKVNKGWGYMKDLIEAEIDKKYPTKMAKGGEVVTYKNKFNKKYGFDKNEGHSLEEISKIAKIKLSSLQDIYDKGIGAYKTNPESVRPNVKSKEQWAMARVYSAIMGGKASKVDANELSEGKMEHGGTFYTRTYNDGTIQKFSVEDYEKNVYPNLEKGGALYLAPNGKESNLTPEQYKLVRTPEFKAWFGDWENDPENASQVVDINGEPLIVYHGSANKFNVFDRKRIGENYRESVRGGFFFTQKLNTAKNYATLHSNLEKVGFVYDCFLNIKNPIIRNVNSEYLSPADKYDISNVEYVSELQRNRNIDGIIIFGTKKDNLYVVNKSNQIKLADGSNATFDSNNPDIRYAKGGLIAPNGNESNLTPEQYKLVRTPEFKAWFGDWENDPENASKVVDENGEPLIVWHGSKSKDDFNVFKQNSRFEFIYFAQKKIYSWLHFTKDISDYHFQLRPFFLNIKNLLNAEEYHFEKIKFNELKSFFYGIHDLGEDMQLNPQHEYRFWEIIRHSDTIFNSLKKQEYYNGISFYENFYENTKLNDFDDWSLVYVVMNPNQIKLADGTNTKFDSNNPDIRFAKGGVAGDIYSIKNAEHFKQIMTIYNELTEKFGVNNYFLNQKDNSVVFLMPKTSNKFDTKKLQKYVNTLSKRGFDVFGDNRNIIIENDNSESGKSVYFKLKLSDIGQFAKGGLIAPNGNESNLTPEQYKLVRTPEFKAWFGDWENDPENASKVVDNNGEPLVAYHGSNNPNINIFDADKSGSVQYSDWGKGIYFTPYKSTANYYSNEALKKIDNEYNRLYEVFEKSQKSEDLKAFQKRGREMSDNENTITYSVFLNIKNPRTEYVDSMSYTDPFLSENAKMENKDGVFIKTSRGRFDEILAFYPNQIKLADGTNTIFDSNNPDIRYSKGGELAKGIKAEKEHLETAKKLYQNKITPEQSAVEIAKDHLKENEHYYTELAKLEKKFAKGGNISDSYSSYEYPKNIKPIFWQMTLKQFCDYAKSNNLDTRLEGTNAKLQCEDFYKYVIIKPLLSNNAERNVFLLAIESNRMPYEAVEDIIKSVNLWDENNRKIIKIIDYINSYNVTSEIWRIPMELYLQKEYFQKNFTKANAIKWYEKHIYQYTYLDDKALKDMIEKGMVKYTDVIERLREAVGLANLSEQDKKQLMKLNETQSINILKGKLNGLLDIIESEKVDTSQFKQVNSIEQSNSKNAEVGKDMNKPQNWSKERLNKEIERLDPNESQGYGVSRNRVLKESMLELPDKARLSFELREFFLIMYGNDFKKEFDKTPLASLSQFFYSDVNSLKEWVDEQIKGIEQNIESNKKYIDSLSNSKSSQKSKEIWLDTIEKSKKIIEKLKSEFEKYEQEKNGFVSESIKLDLIKNPLTESEISFIESIKPEIEKGVSMNKTKIENIAKTFGILEQNRAKELTELSISILARSIAHNPSMNTEGRFDRLVELYQSQPNLSHRTSESMMMQQYSTPAPIGYLMGVYCGIDKKGTKYFEPSAGNGLLVSAGYLDDGTLNELDEIRNKDLQYLGFKNVTQKDGTIPFTEYQKHFDAMLTNPPFGSIESVYYGKYEITSKEQLMSLRGLDTMKDDGKAAIIIGGHMEYDSQGRLKAGKNRTFFVYLYENYNIEDVININGRMLYSKQGTSFNTRLILINGRKKEPKGFFPLITESKPSIEKFSKTPVDTYDDLWTRIIQHI
jgi:hypothetical protein